MSNVETKAFDLTRTIFNSVVVMYVSKDKETPEDYFVVALPVYMYSNFVFDVKELQTLHFKQSVSHIGNEDQQRRLIEYIHDVIEAWDGRE